VTLAAFLIDRDGRIVTMTAAAERIAETAEFITVRDGRIKGVTLYDTQKIDGAIAEFMYSAYREGNTETLLLIGTSGCIANLQISPLKGGEDGAVAIIDIEPLNASAKALDRLTAAEAEVAVALLAGARANEIALQRNVSVETVRSQIKAIYSKFEVRGHVELIAALSRSVE